MKQYLSVVRDRLFGKVFSLSSSHSVPKFPARKGAVIASVLADLLKGSTLNCVDAAQEMHTSRLKDQIASLRKRYGWRAICSDSIAMVTKDGRVQWVSQYWLPADALVDLDQSEIAAWTKAGERERYVQRMNVKRAHRRAKACNARKNSVATNVKGTKS